MLMCGHHRSHTWRARLLLRALADRGLGRRVERDLALGEPSRHCILDELDADRVDSVALVCGCLVLAVKDVAQVAAALPDAKRERAQVSERVREDGMAASARAPRCR